MSESVGCAGFATEYRYRSPETGLLDGDAAAGRLRGECGVARRACDPRVHADAVREAIETARHADRTTAIVIPVDREQRVGGSEAWWDVPIAEVSTIEAVQTARTEYERARTTERASVMPTCESRFMR